MERFTAWSLKENALFDNENILKCTVKKNIKLKCEYY